MMEIRWLLRYLILLSCAPVARLSRGASLEELNEDDGKPHTPTISSTSYSIRLHSKIPSLAQRNLLHDPQQHHSYSHSHISITSLLSLSRPSYDRPDKCHDTEYVVGTFQSQRYLNLEVTRKVVQVLGEWWVCFFLGLDPLFFLPIFLCQQSFPHWGDS